MDFWEFMSKPALTIEIDEDNEEEIKLREENRKLKMMIHKLIEKGIREEKGVLEWK